MVFPVRVFTKICMAPLENSLRDRKAIKELFCWAQFEKLSQEDKEKFRILNKFCTFHQDGGEPREKRTIRGGLRSKSGGSDRWSKRTLLKIVYSFKMAERRDV